VGGVRYFVGSFPQPKRDKNDRIGVVLNDTAKMKKGQRFMSPEAREYREMVLNTVVDVLLAAGADHKVGWFRPGRPWGGVLLQNFPHDTYDSDHYVSGLQDDLCRAGLAKTDRDCFGIFPMKSSLAPAGWMYVHLMEGAEVSPV